MRARANGSGGPAGRAQTPRASRVSRERTRPAWRTGQKARATRRASNDETLRTSSGTETRLPFRCECTETGCAEVVWLTADEYDSIRGRRGRFVVGPGHAHDDVDLLVRSTERYAVVRHTPSELFLG